MINIKYLYFKNYCCKSDALLSHLTTKLPRCLVRTGRGWLNRSLLLAATWGHDHLPPCLQNRRAAPGVWGGSGDGSSACCCVAGIPGLESGICGAASSARKRIVRVRGSPPRPLRWERGGRKGVLLVREWVRWRASLGGRLAAAGHRANSVLGLRCRKCLPFWRSHVGYFRVQLGHQVCRNPGPGRQGTVSFGSSCFDIFHWVNLNLKKKL